MCRETQCGLTLVELLITIVLLGILMSLAVPGYQNYIAQNRVKTGSQSLFTAMLYARSEAIKRNADVYIYPNGGSNTDWEDGWVVTTDSGKSYSDCQSDQTDCLQMQQSLSGIEITTGVDSVVYQGNGRTDAAASFEVCDNDANATIRKRQVSIDLTGRPVIRYDGNCS